FCCQAIRPRAHQLPSQPLSFRLCHCRDLLRRRRDIAEGDSDIDRYERRAGNGLALGCPSQPVLGGRGASVSVSPGHQLGVGAPRRTEAFVPFGREHPGKTPPVAGRRAVKLVRALSRIVLLSLLAAAFAGLTAIYGRAATLPLPNPYWQAERRHRAPAPQVDKFPEFVAEGMVVAIYAVAGRLLLRLRLSRVPHTPG